MNTELKALIKLALDLFKAGKAAIAKQDFVTVLIPAIYQAASDIPAVSSNFSQLQSDISALAGSAQEADLIAYIISEFDGAGDEKAKDILAAVLKLVADVAQDAIALESAIKA